MTISGTFPVTVADVVAAAQVLSPVAVRTPLVASPVLDETTGARVFLKPEILQRTGSFKFRGAYNKLSSIPESSRSSGVVAFSSGNHAQGVAAAAALLGMKATIVMPADAPVAKRERTKAYGAEVVLYDRYRDDREAIARDIASKSGAVLVPPFDDPMVIAGQGTVGLEMAADFAAAGVSPDIVVAPVSGGGLIAGISLAMKARFPDVQMIAGEPAGFDDYARSLKSGRRETNLGKFTTLCDALMSPMPGELTFAINRRLLAAGVSVTDADVRAAVAFAFYELKLVVEPGGVVALAALLSGHIEVRGKTIGIVLSGGNVDADLFADVIRQSV